ncbi:MAG: patatin-like phospholipase family protein [Patescibacteria group bacterium]|nr:patatin-like phospholipase family protein [Patescibacteria group bacterium]
MESNKPFSVGLALGGGTTFGVAHVGVLKALIDEEIPIHCISGTSAGALVAGGFAFGLRIPELIEMARNLKWSKLSRFGYSRLGIHSNERMGKFIIDMLGDVRIEDANIPLAIVATDIETHRMVIFRSGSLEKTVRASTSIPGLFTPVEVDGRLLVDGGLTEKVPITALEEMGASVKIAVNLSAKGEHERPKNVLDVISSSLTILERHRDRELSASTDVLIEPALDGFDASKFKNIEEIMEEGYRATMREIPALREKIATKRIERRKLIDRIRSFFR